MFGFWDILGYDCYSFFLVFCQIEEVADSRVIDKIKIPY